MSLSKYQFGKQAGTVGYTVGATLGSLASFIPVVGPFAGIAGSIAGGMVGDWLGDKLTSKSETPSYASFAPSIGNGVYNYSYNQQVGMPQYTQMSPTVGGYQPFQPFNGPISAGGIPSLSKGASLLEKKSWVAPLAGAKPVSPIKPGGGLLGRMRTNMPRAMSFARKAALPAATIGGSALAANYVGDRKQQNFKRQLLSNIPTTQADKLQFGTPEFMTAMADNYAPYTRRYMQYMMSPQNLGSVLEKSELPWYAKYLLTPSGYNPGAPIPSFSQWQTTQG